MDKAHLEDLICKFHSQTLSEEEKVVFESYLKTSDEARKIFHDWNMLHQALSAYTYLSPSRPAKRANNEPEIIQEKTVLKKIYLYLSKIAAILIIPLIIALVTLVAKENLKKDITYNEITCTKGKVTQVSLSDGTRVYLYTGSKLIYPAQFEKGKREVKLIGEATFEVTSNPKRPFYVNTIDGGKVKAYGTKFNVCAYEKDSLISVFLEKGAVDFESVDLRSPVVLHPGKKVDYLKTRKTYSISNGSADEYNAREEGILLFKKSKLTNIVAKLSKAYEIDIVIRNPQLEHYQFTAVFKEETIFQIMEMLKKSSPDLNWKTENNLIILY